MKIETATKNLKYAIEYTRRSDNEDMILKDKEKWIEALETVLKELEKKDKIINEMTNIMSKNMSCDFIRTTDEKCANIDCEQCFGQYFERKVEND